MGHLRRVLAEVGSPPHPTPLQLQRLQSALVPAGQLCCYDCISVSWS